MIIMIVIILIKEYFKLFYFFRLDILLSQDKKIKKKFLLQKNIHIMKTLLKELKQKVMILKMNILIQNLFLLIVII